MKKRGRLIVLEGVDGVGKTTLARGLGERGALRFCSRKSSEATEPWIREQMQGVGALMWTRASGSRDHLLPAEYWIYLQAVWYTLLSKFVIEPMIVAGSDVVVDGWFYKFFARLLTGGYPRARLDSAFAHVLKPDLVLLLDLDIEAIWSRTKDFRSYEFGTHQGYSGTPFESFRSFQSDTRQNLRAFAAEFGWTALNLAAQAGVEENLSAVAAAIAASAERQDPGAAKSRRALSDTSVDTSNE